MRLSTFPGAEVAARAAIREARDWLRAHSDDAAYPTRKFRHLVGSIHEANRTRPPQLVRECRDVLILLFAEVQTPYPGSRLSRAMDVARKTLTDADQWLEYMGITEEESPLVTKRIEEARLHEE